MNHASSNYCNRFVMTMSTTHNYQIKITTTTTTTTIKQEENNNNKINNRNKWQYLIRIVITYNYHLLTSEHSDNFHCFHPSSHSSVFLDVESPQPNKHGFISLSCSDFYIYITTPYLQIVTDIQVTTGHYFPKVGYIPWGWRTSGIFPTEEK